MEANKRKEIVRYFDVYLGSTPKVIYSVLTQEVRNANLDTNSHKNQTDPGISESQNSPQKEVNDGNKNTW